MFLEDLECDIASYADDNTPYVTECNIEIILKKLESCGSTLFKWFKENYLKANADKCHVLLTTRDQTSMNLEGCDIPNSQEERLLGIKFDTKLSFENHVSSLCKKATQKLHALARIVNYMEVDKRKCLMKAFVTSQFSYCPLIWMFHSRKLNNRINSIHERALRLAYNDYKATFNQLLEKDNSVTIHNRNLQILATEIYKVKNDLGPSIMKEVLQFKEPSYSLRSQQNTFVKRNVKTTHYGLQSIRYLAPIIWDQVPEDIRNSVSLKVFKTSIKKWIPSNCPCRLCKTYVGQVGFI